MLSYLKILRNKSLSQEEKIYPLVIKTEVLSIHKDSIPNLPRIVALIGQNKNIEYILAPTGFNDSVAWITLFEKMLEPTFSLPENVKLNIPWAFPGGFCGLSSRAEALEDAVCAKFKTQVCRVCY